MNSKQRRRARKVGERVRAFLAAEAPGFTNQNPTPEQEREAAQWLLDSKKFRDLTKHTPRLQKGALKIAADQVAGKPLPQRPQKSPRHQVGYDSL